MEVVYAYLPPSSSLPTKRSAPLTSDNNTKPDSFSTGKFRSPPNEIIPVFYPSSSLVIHIVTIALSKSAPSFLPSFQRISSRVEGRGEKLAIRSGMVASSSPDYPPSFSLSFRARSPLLFHPSPHFCADQTHSGRVASHTAYARFSPRSLRDVFR